MIGRILLLGALLAPALVRADETPSAAFEQRVAEATKSQKVTVIHFWAPWCSNCQSELANGGWSGFIAAHPDVNFLFITLWNPVDGRKFLEKHGVGGEKNFQLLLPPNTSRQNGEKLTALLGQPLSWLPTTRIYRDGELLYSMNYGELHFPILQQLIKDSTADW